MNTLFNTEGTWISDGSTDSSIEVDSDNRRVITITSKSRGSPFSTLYDVLDLDDRNMYYEVQVLSLGQSGHISVGLVTKELLQPGYKVRGMFYNGNLTNGSAALKVGFGDYLKQGSKVGVHCLRDSGTTTVSLIVNDVFLGTAFVISDENGGTYYPCLHVSGQATVELLFHESIPSLSKVEAPANEDMLKGEWRLEKLMIGPELGQRQLPNCDIVAKFDPAEQSGCYSFSMKVGNRFNGALQVGEKNEGLYRAMISGVCSTRMMPPPEIRSVEDDVGNRLAEVSKIAIDRKSLLMIGTTIEMHFVPHLTVREPLSSYL